MKKVYTIVTQMGDYVFSILQASAISLSSTNILPYNGGGFKVKILFLLFPFIFFSCGRSEKDIQEGIIIDTALNTPNEIKLSSLVDSITYTPLETKDNLLIGQVTKMLVSDRFIYIFDEISSSLYCFDLNDKFVKKIGNKGVGPGEYTSIDDFDIYNQRIYLFDCNLRKLFVYNNNGILEKEIKTNYWAENIHVIDNSWIALYGGYKDNAPYKKNGKTPNLLFLNIHNGESKSAAFFDSQIEMKEVCGSYKLFTDFGNFLSPLENRIYQLDSKLSLNEKVSFSLSESQENIQNIYLQKIKNEKIDVGQIEDLIQGFPMWVSINETNDYIVSVYMVENKQSVIFYNKKSGEVIKGQSDSGKLPVINDIDGLAQFILYTSHGDMLYSLVQPYAIDKNKVSWAKDIEDEDNPIIVTMHIKK